MTPSQSINLERSGSWGVKTMFTDLPNHGLSMTLTTTARTTKFICMWLFTDFPNDDSISAYDFLRFAQRMTKDDNVKLMTRFHGLNHVHDTLDLYVMTIYVLTRPSISKDLKG